MVTIGDNATPTFDSTLPPADQLPAPLRHGSSSPPPFELLLARRSAGQAAVHERLLSQGVNPAELPAGAEFISAAQRQNTTACCTPSGYASIRRLADKFSLAARGLTRWWSDDAGNAYDATQAARSARTTRAARRAQPRMPHPARHSRPKIRQQEDQHALGSLLDELGTRRAPAAHRLVEDHAEQRGYGNGAARASTSYLNVPYRSRWSRTLQLLIAAASSTRLTALKVARRYKERPGPLPPQLRILSVRSYMRCRRIYAR